MIKLKRLIIDKIDPSVGRKGQIAFQFQDCYLCKNQIGGVSITSNEKSLTDTWVDIEAKKYMNERDIRLCVIHTISDMPSYTNIIVDEIVEELIENL